MNVVFPTSFPPWTTTVTLDLPGEERERESEKRERGEEPQLHIADTPPFSAARVQPMAVPAHPSIHRAVTHSKREDLPPSIAGRSTQLAHQPGWHCLHAAD